MSTVTLPPLFDSITLFVTQHRLCAPIDERHRTVQQIRHLLTENLRHAAHTEAGSLRNFRQEVEIGLRDVEKRCRPGSNAEQQDYIDYCVREISMAVEIAHSIASEHHANPAFMEILLDDLPIFRPCDYGVGTAESTATVTTSPMTSA